MRDQECRTTPRSPYLSRPAGLQDKPGRRLQSKHFCEAARRARNEYERVLRQNANELPSDLHAHLQSVEHVLLLLARNALRDS